MSVKSIFDVNFRILSLIDSTYISATFDNGTKDPEIEEHFQNYVDLANKTFSSMKERTNKTELWETCVHSFATNLTPVSGYSYLGAMIFITFCLMA